MGVLKRVVSTLCRQGWCLIAALIMCGLAQPAHAAGWRIEQLEIAQGARIGLDDGRHAQDWAPAQLPEQWAVSHRFGTWTYRWRGPACSPTQKTGCLPFDRPAALWLPKAGRYIDI